MTPRLPLLLVLVGAISCSAPPSVPPPAPTAAEAAATEVSDVTGAAGGGEDGSLTPSQLTGLKGIDGAQTVEVRVLDAKGTGRQGSSPVTVGPLVLGQWLLTDPGSEFEITVRSSLMPDGIVRLSGQSALLIEPPLAGALPRFRVYGGKASFHMPHLPPGEASVLTPAGPLVTHGAVFTVVVAPDFQTLVTCRDGAIYLTGNQNTVAQPGQVFVADRWGRNRVYAMTPNEAQIFDDRWLQVVTEEAAPVLSAVLDNQLRAWNSVASRDLETSQFLALWFRAARPLLGTKVPGPETWGGVLGAPVRPSAWQPLPLGPGLMGETL